MRKLAFGLVVLCVVCCLTAGAQQRPHYTQYILNNYVINPAISGIENYTDVKMSARDQWRGLKGAPQTFYVTAHAPLGKKDYKTSATSYQVPGQNPRGTAYWEQYTASEPHHGVGLTVVNDVTGLYNRFSAAATYAYHLGLNATTNLSAGFGAGVTRVAFNRSKAFTIDPNDPALAGRGEAYRWRPDLSAGLWLYSKDYFVGLSAQQIIPQTVSFSDNDVYKQTLVPHLFATAGYRFLVSEDVNALPSVLFKYVSNTPTTPQFDVNFKVQYQDLLWTGASYRYQNGFAAMLGLNVGNTFNIGYAYDFTRTAINTASRGTHEVVVGLLINNKYGETCPRNVW